LQGLESNMDALAKLWATLFACHLIKLPVIKLIQ